MEKNREESKAGLYDVYDTEGGTRLIVLSGLRVEDQQTPPFLQEQIHAHSGFISSFYWILFGATLIYMFGVYVLLPLQNIYRHN